MNKDQTDFNARLKNVFNSLFERYCEDEENAPEGQQPRKVINREILRQFVGDASDQDKADANDFRINKILEFNQLKDEKMTR
jgi:hypothetical protein